MHIVAALYIEAMDVRQVPGPSTRIDLSGVFFSLPAPTAPPVTITPHLVVFVHVPAGDTALHALNTVFFDASGTEVLRSRQPLTIEPGKFGYRLVRPELTFEDYGTITAEVRIDEGPPTRVPLTLLPPVA
ncbi:MAG: hypothetical protein C4344_02025 [Acidimicrobiia bacterium]